MSLNCADCKHRGSMDDNPNGQYHSVCENPKLLPLIDSGNSMVRCNETREFSFACGGDAKWFEARSGAAVAS